MARETLDQLGAQLSALLTEIDAAIAARFPESRSRRTTTPRKPLSRMMAAARRWLGRTPQRLRRT